MTHPPEPLFTPRAAAAQLGLSVKTLMAHVAAGNLRFINIERCIASRRKI
jgi:hypothetical protein